MKIPSIKLGKYLAIIALLVCLPLGQALAANNRFAAEHEEAIKKANAIKASEIQHRMEFMATIVDGKATDKLVKQRYERFNKDGLPIQEVNFDEDGKLMSKWTYEYADTYVTKKCFFWGEKLNDEYYYKYDEKKRVVEERKVDNEKKTSKVVKYAYDKNDLVIEEIKEPADRNKFFKRDEQGRELECYYLDNGQKKIIAKKCYNDKGQLIEIAYPAGGPNNKWLYKYDQQGNEIEFRDQDFDETTIKQSKYDDKNRLIETIRWNEGENEKKRVVYSYDGNDNLIEVKGFKGQELEYKRTMTYDANKKMLKEASSNLKNNSQEIITWKRNQHGLEEEERIVDADGKLKSLKIWRSKGWKDN